MIVRIRISYYNRQRTNDTKEKGEHKMQFGTIASGSSGNCLYAGSHHSHILIDAGISGKRICYGLDSFGVSPEQISGILVTHEHVDHISGLGVIMRKFKCRVYATEGTIREILKTKSLGKLPEECLVAVRPGESFNIGDIAVKPFRISHDAREPVSYVLNHGSQQIGMVTDLGYYDEHIVNHLKNSDILYIEANHDIRMLQAGPYPYYLKQRILGNRGHLCNEMAGKLIHELMNDRLKKVILGHLSKENNFPELALETVRQETGLYDGAQYSLFEPEQTSWPLKARDIIVAPRDCASELISM